MFSIMVDVFYEEITDSEIDKFIILLNPAKLNEIHSMYHVDPEDELSITFKDNIL